ncbi:MAG: M20/M25/M40 family metallo-hydrolase [SAR324 cluster bacterium]|nr:M20/M25/M40 family metallo-hydrolase [SAR324 cluster bacterium]
MDRMKECFEALEKDYIKMLRQVVDINSFSYNREGINRVGRQYADWFAELGFESYFVPSTNPLCGDHLFSTRAGRSEQNLILISHLDTVYPVEEEVENNHCWREEKERIYGPGTLDIKGGTVMIYMFLKGLKTIYPDLFESMSWTVLHNASEEIGCLDFPSLATGFINPQTLAALVYEGAMSLEDEADVVLCVSRCGAARFDLETFGRSAHSGNSHRKGVNAIREISRKIEEIESWTDYSRNVTFSIGLVQGGTAANTIPAYASCRIDLRANNPEDFQWGKEKVLGLSGVGSVRSPMDDFPCSVKVQLIGEFPPWPNTDKNAELIELVVKAAEQDQRKVQVHRLRGGASDGNFTYQYVPTVDLLGPIGSNHHCSLHDPEHGKEQEYIVKSSIVPQAMLSVRLVHEIVKKEGLRGDTQRP